MMMTKKRHDDASSYTPDSDRRPSPWNQLDTVAQRIIAIAAAGAILIGVLAWVGKTLSTDARLTKIEEKIDRLESRQSDTKNVVCFLAKKSDQPIIPASCNTVTP